MEDQPTRDAPTEFEFTQDGQTILMVKDGATQFFYLSVKKGKLPDKLAGAWTTYDIAKRAVDQYFEERKIAKAA